MTEHSEMDQAKDWIKGDAPCGLLGNRRQGTGEQCKNVK